MSTVQYSTVQYSTVQYSTVSCLNGHSRCMHVSYHNCRSIWYTFLKRGFHFNWNVSINVCMQQVIGWRSRYCVHYIITCVYCVQYNCTCTTCKYDVVLWNTAEPGFFGREGVCAPPTQQKGGEGDSVYMFGVPVRQRILDSTIMKLAFVFSSSSGHPENECQRKKSINVKGFTHTET